MRKVDLPYLVGRFKRKFRHHPLRVSTSRDGRHIERRASAGINTFRCPVCDNMNHALSKIGETPRFFGTLFVPVTLRQLAEIAVGHPVVATVACHHSNHHVKVTLRR